MSALQRLRYADIGINLSDLQFSGIYHGKKHHEDDREKVIERARFNGVDKMLVTSSYLQEAKEVIKLCEPHPDLLYCTVGVHPCHATDVTKQPKGTTATTTTAATVAADYYKELRQIALDGKNSGIVKAFGEIGLDYDRLHFAPANVQRDVFKAQLDIAVDLDLPLFLHSRAADEDFGKILFPYLESGSLKRGGVVHSFTGTVEEMKLLVSKGLYIGVNGCSLKTEENLEVVKHVPLSKLLLETDGPWCEIRPSHASFRLHLATLKTTDGQLPKKPSQLLPFPTVKKEKFADGTMITGRCEPCAIGLVAQVVASIKGVSAREVAEAAWKNTMDLFQLE